MPKTQSSVLSRSHARNRAPPGEILLLDDDNANVESALGVGWQATQFRIGGDIHALLHAHGISTEG